VSLSNLQWFRERVLVRVNEIKPSVAGTYN
jgi:hypothetical protein